MTPTSPEPHPYTGPPTRCWVCDRFPDPDRHLRGCDRTCATHPKE